jgi:hypothetical protein
MGNILDKPTDRRPTDRKGKQQGKAMKGQHSGQAKGSQVKGQQMQKTMNGQHIGQVN